MWRRGRAPGLPLVGDLPRLGALGRAAAPRSGGGRAFTLFVLAPGRRDPLRLRLPGWLVVLGLLALLGLAGAGLRLAQENQALNDELAALRRTQTLAASREGELHTVVNLQKDKLTGQNSQLDTQNQQIAGIRRDLDDLKDHMVQLD